MQWGYVREKKTSNDIYFTESGWVDNDLDEYVRNGGEPLHKNISMAKATNRRQAAPLLY